MDKKEKIFKIAILVLLLIIVGLNYIANYPIIGGEIVNIKNASFNFRVANNAWIDNIGLGTPNPYISGYLFFYITGIAQIIFGVELTDYIVFNLIILITIYSIYQFNKNELPFNHGKFILMTLFLMSNSIYVNSIYWYPTYMMPFPAILLFISSLKKNNISQLLFASIITSIIGMNLVLFTIVIGFMLIYAKYSNYEHKYKYIMVLIGVQLVWVIPILFYIRNLFSDGQIILPVAQGMNMSYMNIRSWGFMQYYFAINANKFNVILALQVLINSILIIYTLYIAANKRFLNKYFLLFTAYLIMVFLSRQYSPPLADIYGYILEKFNFFRSIDSKIPYLLIIILLILINRCYSFFNASIIKIIIFLSLILFSVQCLYKWNNNLDMSIMKQEFPINPSEVRKRILIFPLQNQTMYYNKSGYVGANLGNLYSDDIILDALIPYGNNYFINQSKKLVRSAIENESDCVEIKKFIDKFNVNRVVLLRQNNSVDSLCLELYSKETYKFYDVFKVNDNNILENYYSINNNFTIELGPKHYRLMKSEIYEVNGVNYELTRYESGNRIFYIPTLIFNFLKLILLIFVIILAIKSKYDKQKV